MITAQKKQGGRGERNPLYLQKESMSNLNTEERTATKGLYEQKKRRWKEVFLMTSTILNSLQANK